MKRAIFFSLVAVTAPLHTGVLQGAEELRLINRVGAYSAKPVATRTLEDPVDDYDIKVLAGSRYVAFTSEKSLHVLPSDIGTGDYEFLSKGPAVNLKAVLDGLPKESKLAVGSNESAAYVQGEHLFVQSRDWVASVTPKLDATKFLGEGIEAVRSSVTAERVFEPKSEWPAVPLSLPDPDAKRLAAPVVMVGRGSETVITQGETVITSAADLGFGIYEMKPSPDGKKLLLYAGDSDYYVFDRATSKAARLNLEATLNEDEMQSVAWGSHSSTLFAVVSTLTVPKDPEEEPRVITNGLVAINLEEGSAGRIDLGKAPQDPSSPAGASKLMDLEGDPNRLEVVFSANQMLGVSDPFSNSVNLLSVTLK